MSPAALTFRIAVRELCEFTAKTGDLDLRFTPSPTAEQGKEGHRYIGSTRGPTYQTEVALSGDYKELHVRGRADGFDPENHQLEEFKTCIGDWRRIPENHRALHWAQLKIYGHLLCVKQARDSINLGLIYFDVLSQKEHPIVELYSKADLAFHFENQCNLFLVFARAQLQHRKLRDDSLAALQFSHPTFRDGQRMLAEAVYRQAVFKHTEQAPTGSVLLAQAPTGIGKTIGVLFPLLKAMPRAGIDKLFYLTAKGTGRQLAINTLSPLHEANPVMPIRALELIARDNACVHLDKACHGDSCPLANGFYDRLGAARDAALALIDKKSTVCLDQASVLSVALNHSICPYYLSQDLVRWCDVVIGDYNYYFDSSALLFSLGALNEWRVVVAIDETHNLIERGRAMYSAQLSIRQLRDTLEFARDRKFKDIRKPLDKAYKLWKALEAEQSGKPYAVLTVPPPNLLALLQDSITAILALQTEQRATPIDLQLQTFMLDALRFTRLADAFDQHAMADQSINTKSHTLSSVLAIRNVIPAPWLAPRFASAHCTIAFSATLTPWHFYRNMLGFPEGDKTQFIDVPSPFSREQLQVNLNRKISTRYTHREQSIEPICALINEQFNWKPGNYLAFFSSFDYMDQVLQSVQLNHPSIPLWAQSRGMDTAARSQFLDRFALGSQGIGFAVMGGIFGEGIDLPGNRLIGAFVATLGLPQINPVNEQMRAQIQAKFGDGYEYTYLYPGLQKVVQAAGRVIRTTADRGTVHLIDDRFLQPKIRGLLPQWWGL